MEKIYKMRAEQNLIMKRLKNNLIKLDDFTFDNKDKWHVRITVDQIKFHNAKSTQNLMKAKIERINRKARQALG